VPLRALADRNPGVDLGQTEDIMMGCGFQAGEQGYNVGRSAQLLAGIDHHVPATTVNRFSDVVGDPHELAATVGVERPVDGMRGHPGIMPAWTSG
jgi:acetyl-CoA acetyltransferase